MTTPEPRVTVLMPVFNGRPYLERAIASVLDQTFAGFELLVVDDASTDGSAEHVLALSDRRVRLIRNARNLGLTASLNRGIAEARSPLIARLDADDLAEPTRLERQVAFLDANPAIALVGSAVAYVDAGDRPFMAFAFPASPEEIYRELLHWNCFSHSCVTFRKDAVERVGGYRTSMRYAQDYDLWLRLCETHSLANLGDILGGYRVHESQVSQTRRREQRALANACRHEAAMARHRLGKLPDPDRFAPPRFWARLLGGDNTLGADSARWARIFRRMGRPGRSLRHALRACVDSPLGLEGYKEAVRAGVALVVPQGARRRLNWYSTKARDYLGGSGAHG